MPESDYGKYFVRKPIREAGGIVKGRQSPTMTYMSSAQVPEANYYIEFGWIYDIPDPNPHNHEMVHHNYDEIVLHIGGDPENPEDLGGEIEFYVGGQPLTFSTNTALFVPRGVRHGPIIWKKFTKPHIEMAIMLGTGDPKEGWGDSGIKTEKGGLPEKTDDIDYEKYLVRAPLREAGGIVKGRQSPTMTYMSSAQVPEASYYIELGWIYGIPEPNPHIHEHVHNFDEIVLHWGGDPDNPEDLGGEIEFCVEGEPFTFNTTTGIFMPGGTRHGPLTWKKFTRPHIQMAFMLGTGSMKEGWEESGISGRKE